MKVVMTYPRLHCRAVPDRAKVDDAVGPGNNEVVGYAGTPGQYRWRVKATSGSGGYSLGWNP